MIQPEHLTPREVSARLRKDVGTLANWRSKGIGPAYLKLGHRTVVYKLADVEAFEAKCRVEPVLK